jgi:SAM-dependent methyltransferase
MANEKLLLQEAFGRIYVESQWGKGSGPGSSPSNTIEYRAFVSRFIEANAIRSVTDLGCGDWQFSYLVDWSGLDYLGIDAVPAVVERNQKRFGQPNIQFKVSNSPKDLPGGDLLLSKEVLQHLPNALITAYLEEIRSKYRFALLTNATRPTAQVNVDIAVGDFRPIRLQDPPFCVAGAIVLTYFPFTEGFIWKNDVFLLFGR